MALAVQGVIPFETAAALVLGENIGTTITAYLASIGTTTNAKRAAYAHCIFNVVGVLWITAIFGFYISLVLRFLPHDPTEVTMANGLPTYEYMEPAIAAVHTGFNVTNTLLFIPLIGIMARFLKRVVPDKPHKEAPHLTGLDIRGLETPVIGIEQSRVEVVRMGECLDKMMDKLRAITTSDEPDENLARKLFHREEVLDIMQKEVVHFLSALLGDELPHEVVNEGRMQLRMADEYESAGDYVADVLKLRMRLQEAEMEFTDEGRAGLVELHDAVAEYIRMVNEAYEQRHTDIISKARTQGEAITHKVRDLREKHLARVTSQHIPPLASVLYTDSLSAYRRVKDHILNIAEALAGQK
jgi:phosphate:Na+ symporter